MTREEQVNGSTCALVLAVMLVRIYKKLHYECFTSAVSKPTRVFRVAVQKEEIKSNERRVWTVRYVPTDSAVCVFAPVDRDFS